MSSRQTTQVQRQDSCLDAITGLELHRAMASRRDRSAAALRPLALSQGLLSRADGSAQFSFGDVAVLGSVTGPAEVRIRDELVDRATLEVNVRPLRGQGGPGIKAIEATLTSLLTPLLLLHLYPRALLQLTLQTVSSPSTAFSLPTSTDPLLNTASDSIKKGKQKGKARGVATGASERAATINAAMLAFVDAGVQCRGMLVAVAVAFLPRPPPQNEEEEMVLDPTPEEEERATSTHVFAFSSGVGVGGTEGTCVGIDSTGTFSEDQLFDAQDFAQTAAQTVLAFIRKSIETKYGAESGPAPTVTRPMGATAEKEEEEEEQEEDGDDDEDDDKVMIDA